MFTKPTLACLQNERNNLFNSHTLVITPEMEPRKPFHIENMRRNSKFSNQSYSLLDLDMIMISDTFSAYTKRLFKPSINTKKPGNWKYLNRLCHQDDIYFNTETDILFYNIVMSLEIKQRKHIQLQYTRRLKNRHNTYDLYIIRVHVLECDENGLPWLISIETELMPEFKTTNFHPNRQFILFNEADNVIEKRFVNESTNELTHQELEVLTLACKGYKMKEMLSMLFIEECTLKTHRSRIMEKLNAPSMELACIIARKLRLIEC